MKEQRKWVIYAYRSTVTGRWNYSVKQQGEWYSSYTGSWAQCVAALGRWGVLNAA